MKEEGRRKKEEGRRKREEGEITMFYLIFCSIINKLFLAS